MKRFMITFALAGTATSFAQVACAQESSASSKAQEMFAQADTNHDNVLTLEEWKAAGRRERGYTMIDANKDGKVTPEELRAAAAKRGY